MGVEVVGPARNGFLEGPSATLSSAALSVLSVLLACADPVVRLHSVLAGFACCSLRGGSDFRKCQSAKIPRTMYPASPKVAHQSDRICETTPSDMGTVFSAIFAD